MVEVPVGVEDQVQPPPAGGLDLGQDGLGVRRVHGRDHPGRLVADQEAVVVRQAGELAHGQGHAGILAAEAIRGL
ncbi:hypothetical protein D3C75_1188580 [compost metagenome]